MRPTDFASSIRGQYIISQALCVAIDKMNEAPDQMREVSNISDMEFLRDELFPIYKAVQDSGVYQECEECGGNIYSCECLSND